MPAGRSGSKGVARPVREAQILDAAAIELGQRGYAATTVDIVAARARISKPLIYGYFGNKEGLYCACVERAGKHLTHCVATALAQPDQTAFEQGLEVLRSVFTGLEARPHDWNILFDTSLPQGSEAMATAQHYHHRLQQLAAEGVTASLGSALPAPQDLSAFTDLWLNMITALVNWWLKHPDQTAQDMTERSRRLLSVLGPHA
ncbi:TetR/AcrR family transcriptional regulator [Rhodococcus qingshengii]|uniref:TetR/AcrR family transcriptional regulator n=1 Tax=Rhodococcus qingshengii TaxID=334542 RepID=UPI001BECFFCA|nr:TetR/AcrR family transcriptional regulator [Rhodococcus qingshengii]MBT2270082.1 TetR/AcrR family transcriptional regulator [Rhodococcus qingshengii]